MIDNLIAAEHARPDPRPDEEVVRDYLDAADEDILADPHVQCEWLREAGFEDVDVFFQVPEMAIFGGVRRGGSHGAGTHDRRSHPGARPQRRRHRSDHLRSST